MNFYKIRSPNFTKKIRKYSNIKYIIIHYTGMQSTIESLKRLTSIKSQVSCHYLLDREGKIIQLVEDNKIAWHAGKSKWGKIENLNKYSIGIELQNRGHKFKYENYSRKQIRSLITICKKIKRKYKIKNRNILGHSDIAPNRKIDPGEKFPWKVLYNNGLGLWYKMDNYNKKNFLREDKRVIFFNNLLKIGYRYFKISSTSKQDKKVVAAFQRRYVQKKVTGKIDQKTLIISHLLASKINNS